MQRSIQRSFLKIAHNNLKDIFLIPKPIKSPLVKKSPSSIPQTEKNKCKLFNK